MSGSGQRTVRGQVLVLLAAMVALAIAGRSPAAAEAAGPVPEGRLLVVNEGDGTLMAFDEPSHRLLATVKVGARPREILLAPGGRKAYISLVGDRSVAVMNLDDYRVVRSLRPPGLGVPDGLGITPDGRYLLLTSEGGRRLFLFDARRDVLSKAVTTTQRGPHGVAIPAGGKRAFLSNRGSGTVTLVALPALRIMRHAKVGSGPDGIAPTPNGRWVLVGLQETGQLAVLDAVGGDVVARLPTGKSPTRAAAVPDTNTALVTNRDSNDVTIIDVLGRRVLRTLAVGRRPGGIATNDHGSRAYVSNGDSNTVSVISLPGYEVTATIATGAAPYGVAYVPTPREKVR
jgi:YVTN family beta-propeller protein